MTTRPTVGLARAALAGGRHQSVDIARSYELGANCYVSKPGNLDDYFLAVQSIEEFWFGSASLPRKEK